MQRKKQAGEHEEKSNREQKTTGEEISEASKDEDGSKM